MEFLSQDIRVPHRQAGIPATVVMPALPAGQKAPLVAYAHGFAGNRNENGAITLIAEGLARRGIASVRMDFAGCGDSEESAINGALSDMVGDVLACYDHVRQHYPIDENRLGLLGNSMGSWVSLEVLATGKYPAKAVLLMAPAASNHPEAGLFGGQAGRDAAEQEALARGYYELTTFFGAKMQLSPKWFSDCGTLDVFRDLPRYDGVMQVLYAADDEVVPATATRGVAEFYGAEYLEFSGGGHTFGFYTGQDAVRDRVVAHVVDYFARQLEP